MRKILLIILVGLFAMSCGNSEFNYMIVKKIEVNNFNQTTKYKFRVTFRNGNQLYTNRNYKVNDTLR